MPPLSHQPDMIYDPPLPPSRCSHRSSPRSKLPYSYSSLITLAIRSSPEGRMTLREIYQWLSSEYPDRFVTGDGACLGWQNTVRHNLSVERGFVKVSRIIEEQHETVYGLMNFAARGRGHWWTLRHKQEEAQLRLLSGGLKREDERRLDQKALGHSDVHTLPSQYIPGHTSSLEACYPVLFHLPCTSCPSGGREERLYYSKLRWKVEQQVSLDSKNGKKEEGEHPLNHSPAGVHHPHLMCRHRHFPSRLSEPAIDRPLTSMELNLEVGHNVRWDEEATSCTHEFQKNALKLPECVPPQLRSVTEKRQELVTWRRPGGAHKDEAMPENRVSIRNLLNPKTTMRNKTSDHTLQSQTRL